MGVSTAIVRGALNTSTGTQDFTSSGFGTPKAAVVIVSSAIADATPYADAVLSVGLIGGGNERVQSVRSDDGVATSDTYARAASTESIMALDGSGNVLFEANFDSFITDGVRLNITVAPASAFRVTIRLFTGSDLTAHANHFTSSASVDGSVAVTSPGFQPDLVIFAGCVQRYNDITGNLAAMSLGAARRSPTTAQACVTWGDQDNQTPVNKPFAKVSNALAYKAISDGGAPPLSPATEGTGIEVTAWSASGFTATSRGVANQDRVGYLALSFAGTVGAWVGTFQTPTSAGEDDVTTPGFRPQAVDLLLTHCESVNTVEADVDGNGGTLGVGMFDSSGGEACVAIASEDNSSADTQSFSDAKMVNVPDHQGSISLVAAFDKMLSSGWRADWSAVANGSARYAVGIAIEEFDKTLELDPAPVTLSVPAQGITQILALSPAVVSVAAPAATVQPANALSLAAATVTLTPVAPTVAHPIVLTPAPAVVNVKAVGRNVQVGTQARGSSKAGITVGGVKAGGITPLET